MSNPLSLRQQIGQLINVRIGSNLNPCATVAEDRQRVADLVRRFEIGSLCLFNGGSASEVCDTLSQLQASSPVPLLVGADMECGSGQQIPDHCMFPHALAFGALDDEGSQMVRHAALLTAQQARSVGIHVSFSPVADIHRNPRNPIIATRAFGTTADRVTELASAYVGGCHEGGLLCSAKHFPGHGNTHEDSHALLPVVDESREQLDQTDLRPFEALSQSDVDFFMTAHVAYPALDPSGKPATLSYPILTTLLRDAWGYGGAVVSDSFKMDGLRKQATCEGELAADAIAAGVDILLDVTDVERIVKTVEARANRDEKFARRVAEAADRVMAIKRRVENSSQQTGCDLPEVQRKAEDLAAYVASRALRCRGDLPLPIGGAVPAVLLNPQGDVGYTKTDTLRALLAKSPNVSAAHTVIGDEHQSLLPGIVEAAQKAGGCVIVFVIAPSAWQRYGLPDWQESFVREVTNVCPSVVGSLGIAEPLETFDHAAVRIAAFSDTPPSQSALVQRVFG